MSSRSPPASPRAGITKYLTIQRELRPDLYMDNAVKEKEHQEKRRNELAVEMKVSMGNTDLHDAIMRNAEWTSAQMVALAAERPRMLNIQNKDGKTPLHYLVAMVESRARLGHLLTSFLGHGACLYTADGDGLTPLGRLGEYEFGHRVFVTSTIRRLQSWQQSSSGRKRQPTAVAEVRCGSNCVTPSGVWDDVAYTVDAGTLLVHPGHSTCPCPAALTLVAIPQQRYQSRREALWGSDGSVYIAARSPGGAVTIEPAVSGLCLPFDTMPDRTTPAAGAALVDAGGLLLAWVGQGMFCVRLFCGSVDTCEVFLGSSEEEDKSSWTAPFFTSCGGVTFLRRSPDEGGPCVMASASCAEDVSLVFQISDREFYEYRSGSEERGGTLSSQYVAAIPRTFSRHYSVQVGDWELLEAAGLPRVAVRVPLDGAAPDPFSAAHHPSGVVVAVVRHGAAYHDVCMYDLATQRMGFLCRVPTTHEGVAPMPSENQKMMISLDFNNDDNDDDLHGRDHQYLFSATGRYLYQWSRITPTSSGTLTTYDWVSMVNQGAEENFLNVMLTASVAKVVKGVGAAPIGHVCLVFTDVQSSTMLWDKCEAGMSKALALHNELMRDEMKQFNGYEVKTEGDAFMVAFGSTLEALNWCLSCQRKLLDMPWPPEMVKDFDDCSEVREGLGGGVLWRGLRVRMGFHSGRPIVSDDPATGRKDYFGPVVNLAARVGGSGKGGQIVCSADALREIAQFCFFTEAEYQLHFSKKVTDDDDDEDEDADQHRTVCPVSVRYIDTKSFKGITQPQQVFEILPLELCSRFGFNKNDVAKQYAPISKALGIYNPEGGAGYTGDSPNVPPPPPPLVPVAPLPLPDDGLLVLLRMVLALGADQRPVTVEDIAALQHHATRVRAASPEL